MTKKALLHPSIIFKDSGFIISVPVPTFIFPCPRKNSCVGREKNIPRQRREIIRVFVENESVIEKGINIYGRKIQIEKGCVMAYDTPSFYLQKHFFV